MTSPWGQAPTSPVPNVSAPNAPFSGVPVSGLPVSGYPAPGGPVSGYPVSGSPVSAMPVSGYPSYGNARAVGTARPHDAQQALLAEQTAAQARDTAPVVPLRRRDAFGPLAFGQVVCWQIAVVLVVLGLTAGPVVLVVAVVLAFALLVLTLVRVKGLWVYQLLGRYLQFTLRRRVATESAADTRESLVAFLRGYAKVTTVELDDLTVGVLDHPDGLTAVLEFTGDLGVLNGGALNVPSPAALLPPGDGPAITLQLLVQTTPAPTPAVPSPVAQSYLQLNARTVPARRQLWLAVQMERQPAYSEVALRQSLVGAVRRLTRRLKNDEVQARPLARDELLSALSTAAHLASPDPGPAGVYRSTRASGHQGRPIGRETWSAWWTGEVPQASYQVLGWPDPRSEPGRHLLAKIFEVPTLATTVSLATRRRPARQTAAGQETGSPADGEILLELTVRTAASDQAGLDLAETMLTHQVASIGGRLTRMDGNQAAGLASTLPFGGFLS